MTRRLYYDHPYLREFAASVIEADPAVSAVYLDTTAFYPTSGGQLHDTGRIGEARVVDVIDEDTRVRHSLDRPLDPGVYECAIDWPRRFDHMQQHTGQHLLSAVFHELYGLDTLSVHFGDQTATIDLAVPLLESGRLSEAEDRANALVFENRNVVVSCHEAASLPTLRKATDREGTIRVVTIEGVDASACGGTHVRSTAEIGPIRIVRLDRIRGNVRVEFTCGLRTLASWRAALDAAVEAGEAAGAKLAGSEKQRRKIAAELATFRGRERYRETPPVAGVRFAVHRIAEQPDDELRAEANAFTAGTGAAIVVCRQNPPSLFVAVSADSTLNAGAILKPILERAGGRGGGSARFAQGSLPAGNLEAVLDELVRLCSPPA